MKYIKVSAFFILLAVFLSCTAAPMVIDTPDIGTLSDGVYRGSHASRMIAVTLDVFIVSGKIDKVVIVRHRCGLGRPAEAIVDRVVAAQSLSVDTVSGATGSSWEILLAIQDALSRPPQNGK